MTAGRRPFAGETVDEVADGIRRQRLRPPPAVAEAADDIEARTAVLAFAAGMLTAPPPARPATPEAFAAALRTCVPGRLPEG